MIALDMDGTLLDSNKQCSERTIKALNDAKKQGVIILPATGRAINGLPQPVKELGVRYGIFCNGATNYDFQEKKAFVTNHLTAEQVIRIFEICEKYDASHDIYAGGQGYCEAKYLDVFETYTPDVAIQNLIRQTRQRLDGDLVEFILENQLTIEKVNMFFRDLEEREQAKKELAATGMVDCVSSLYNNLEINKKGCNKGRALMQIAEYFGFAREEVMACGDADNDLQMIEAAGIGVAMANAMDSVKEIADYITDTNDNDGVAKAIEKFVLKK